ncbi:MAG: FMN-binding protein, partial [Clostridia bacterium]|nr:FMN-binding protein [Clostridia bacterium]
MEKNKKKTTGLPEEAVTEAAAETTVTPDTSLEELSVALDEADSVSEPEEVIAEEFEEVNETAEEPVSEKPKKPHDSSSPSYLAKMVLVLTVISMAIALLLAVVNGMTADVIAANIEKQKNEAVLAVFPDGTDVRTFHNADGEEIYIILKDGEILGSCVNVAAAGYNGDVSMMIGMNTAHEICGIKIVSMSETPGVGTKVQGATFLERFFGMSEPVEIGVNVDGISGATYSSRAIADGVNLALAVQVDYEEAAASIGADLSADDMDPEDHVNANEENGDEQLDIGQAGESDTEEQPAAEPEVAPVTEPEPEVIPEPEPVPEEPEPQPEATPEPEIPVAAEPESVPAPQPEPEPAPAPQPEPEPAPVPQPEPAPAPAPQPEPAPAPAPQPEPEPAPAPQPEPEPAPAPQPEPEPEP